MKKRSLSFKLIYLIYVLILAALVTAAVLYVRALLFDYEASQPERHAQAAAQQLCADAASGDFWGKYNLPEVTAGPFEQNRDIKADYLALFQEDSLTVSQTGSSEDELYYTVERDGLLSHFDVHVSPIYYLMLPFYMIAPGPYTLQVLQAAVMASAVIPLWLIGKRHGLSGLQRTLLCGVLLLYPAFSGAAGYDIHENCFLTPCILWLFYGIDRKSILITGIGGLLTLMATITQRLPLGSMPYSSKIRITPAGVQGLKPSSPIII